MLGCKHTCVTPYNPQSNGQCERSNAFYEKSLNSWDDYLLGIVSVYSSDPHASTEFTPSYLMFARHIALLFEPSRPIISLPKPSDYLTYLARHRQITLQAARTNVIRHQQVAKQRFDKHRKNPTYALNDIVFIRQPGVRSKSAPTYNGPYTVVKILSPQTYIVKTEHENREHQVHVNDMHPMSDYRMSP